MRILNTLFVISLLAINFACTKKVEVPLTIKIDGSSTVYPITEAIAEEFQKVKNNVRITVGVSGTGGGFKKFVIGETDINNASRPIKDSEKEESQKHGIEFAEIPVAFDGLSIVVNKENTWVNHLTVKELHELWKPESTIKTWADLRKGWPKRTIKLYGPGVDSGTFDYFTEAINGKAQMSRADFAKSEDDNVLVQGVSGDLDSLGYFGYSYYKENKDKLEVVPIDNGKGAVGPDEETIKNGTYAPLSRKVYMYVNKQKLSQPHMREYMKFYLEEVGKLVHELGFVSLNNEEYQKTKNDLAL